MSLYAITEEMQRLLDVFDQHGDSGSETAAAMQEHIAALAEAFDAKADSYAALIRVCEVRSQARKEEAQRLIALSASDASLADRLRNALMQAMQATRQTRVETERFRLAVRQNGGKLPILIADTDAIPQAYRIPVVTERIDKDGIRDALERGETVPGASLGVRGFRLDLR